MDFDPESEGPIARNRRLQRIEDETAAGRFVPLSGRIDEHMAWVNGEARRMAENSNRSESGSIVGILGILVLIGLFWCWYKVGPSVRYFFDDHFTDPWIAMYSGKLALKEKNYPDALYWFEIGAAHGNVEAQFDLGLMYLNAPLGSKNRAEATAWIKRAAASGYVPAKQWLSKNSKFATSGVDKRKI
ncbi:MAG: hypothetical protein WA734_18215 [Candidatus Acidiferrales bacterium]